MQDDDGARGVLDRRHPVVRRERVAHHQAGTPLGVGDVLHAGDHRSRASVLGRSPHPSTRVSGATPPS